MSAILIAVIAVETIIIGLMIIPTWIGVQSYKLLKDPDVREALDSTLKSLQAANAAQRERVRPFTTEESASLNEAVRAASSRIDLDLKVMKQSAADRRDMMVDINDADACKGRLNKNKIMREGRDK
jgi:hypothetical protein